jgi:glycosyltransferase involved in cell wall biosynthesis
VSVTTAERFVATSSSAGLVVAGIRNPRSLGVSRYAALLAEALADEGIDYRLARRAPRLERAHFHFANSSRELLLDHQRRVAPFVVTVHDVVPRTRALRPAYRVRVYPQLVRGASAVIVHSTFAADLLLQEAGSRPARLEVVPHPARAPRSADRLAARAALGWPDDSLIAVVPGVIKSAKLVRETLSAASGDSRWQVALAGRLVDRSLLRRARSDGALVLADPDHADYERAIVASDCVLCVRSGSVGETNGPLLDALGSGRAVLATATGSIPETARNAALYCEGTELGIRTGLEQLAGADVRGELERSAAKRAGELTWEASATRHAELFRDVLDG